MVLVGGGNMGAALLGGIIDAGVLRSEQIAVAETSATRRAELRDTFGGVAVGGEVVPAHTALIAVKPPDVAAAVTAAVAAGAVRVVSIAAGVTIASIEAAAGEGIAVLRAMPNTPALVGEGYAAVAPGTAARDDDVSFARALLGAVGTVAVMPEPYLDAVTGVAGSGPAYVFLIAEAMIDAAVREGIARDVAEPMVAQLLLGSATLLSQQGNPHELRARVTSPGGTTAAGLAELEAHGLRAALAAAVRAATERSRELR